jgi:hypothetical protein
MRSLLQQLPGQAENILSVREAFFGPLGILPEDMPSFGLTLTAITAWDTARLSTALGENGLGEVGIGGPDAISSVRVRLTLPVTLFPGAADSLAAWLGDHHAPVTVMRPGGAFRFGVQEKAQKKRMLLAGGCARVGDDQVMEITIGTKPFLGSWLEGSFETGAARLTAAEILGMD